MDPLAIGHLGCAAFVALIFLRVPIAYGMAIVGTIGLFFVYGFATVFRFVPLEVYSQYSRTALDGPRRSGHRSQKFKALSGVGGNDRRKN
jgi:hypothetical protein